MTVLETRDGVLQDTRFCPECASPLEGDRCDEHGIVRVATRTIPGIATASLGARVGASMRALVTSRYTRVVVVAAVVAIAAVRVHSASDEASRARHAADAADVQLRRLRREVQADRSALNGLSNRTSTVEQSQRKTPDRAAVVKRVSRSVFTVKTDAGLGSGWVIASSPTRIVTNYHVVEDNWVNHRTTVSLVQGDQTRSGEIIEVWPDRDLAIIRTADSLTPLSIASSRPSVGDSVLAAGSPLGLEGTVSAGIVSSFRTEDGLEFLQFSAPISPGNSGGPVVNDRGDVVGIAVAKYTGDGAEGLSFAIPIDVACDLLSAC